MNYDNKIKKDWYYLNSMQYFTGAPQNENERKCNEIVKEHARKTGDKVQYIFFDKTEKEVHDWFKKHL